MGKNSLIKSTSKKKKNQKKTEDQEVTRPSVEPEPAVRQKAKAALPKKQASPQPAPRPTYAELIFKKFTDRQPEKQVLGSGLEKKQGQYEAPPFYSSKIQAEIRQFKALLFKKFDLTTPAQADEKILQADEKAVMPGPVVETVPGPEKAPAPKPTYAELIFKKFTDRQPEKQVFGSGLEKKQGQYEAPPFYSSKIQAEIRQFKALLFKKFELPAVVEPDEENPPEDETAAVPVPAVETAPVEKIVRPITPTPPLKRVAPEQSVVVSYEKAKKPSDPKDSMMKAAAAVFAFLVLAVVGASASNHGTYHLTVKNGKTQIWQGRFGPMGKTLLTTLPDAALADTVRTTGSKKQIFPFIVAYYLNKADSDLETAETPDFKNIRSLLTAADRFAATPELKKEILVRANAIDLTALLYKAQVAAGLETPEGFARALAYLENAKSIEADGVQSELVARKIQTIEQKLADLELPGVGPETQK